MIIYAAQNWVQVIFLKEKKKKQKILRNATDLTDISRNWGKEWAEHNKNTCMNAWNSQKNVKTY